MVIVPARSVRPGHSLPELIVAVTFLAASVVPVGAMAVLGGRWTARAVARQDAVRLAAAVLDSVAAAPPVSTGTTAVNGFRVRWSPAGGESWIRVEVSRGDGEAPLAVLQGVTVPVVPALPDEADADSAAMSTAPLEVP